MRASSLSAGPAEQGAPPPSSARPAAARPAAAFGIAGAGGVGVVTAAGVVAEVAAGAVVRLARVAHPVERRRRLRARGGCRRAWQGASRAGCAGGASVLLEAVAGVFGGAGCIAAEEVFQRAAEDSGEQQHLRIHHAALAVLDLEDGFSHNVPPQKLAGPGEILLRPLPGAAQFFDGGAHDVDFLCCGHVTVSVQF